MTHTLFLSLGITAVTIFVAVVLFEAAIHAGNSKQEQICETAASIVFSALQQAPNQLLMFKPTESFQNLERDSPSLWFVASASENFLEFNRDRRPVLPLKVPYAGPITRATLLATGTGLPVCLDTQERPGQVHVVVMIGGAKPGLALSLISSIESEVATIGMVGGAIAAFVAAGVFLAAGFVRHNLSRVTRIALAINPPAPQGSIPRGEVPVELRV
jgi:hypothetical protein